MAIEHKYIEIQFGQTRPWVLLFQQQQPQNINIITLIVPRGRIEEKRTGTKPTAPTVLSKFNT